MIEIRWHGRGGQGAVTASEVVASAAMREGRDIQAYPDFSGERMGAPVRAFTRISKEEIKTYSHIKFPDVIVILDLTLLKSFPTYVLEGVSQETKVILNAASLEERIKNMMRSDYLYLLNANKISEEEMGIQMPNTPCIGGLNKVVRIVNDMKNLKNAFKERFRESMDPEILEKNLNAMMRGHEEVKELAND